MGLPPRRGRALPLSAAAILQGAIWSAGPFDPIADGAAPAHDALLSALAPAEGARWLDVATGTGPVALRAARAGAEVTAIDIAPGMLASARRKAAAAGVSIRFDLGAAERLPYGSAAFDVVSSAQGVIFALDPRAAAAELARVCRPGGRLGLTCLIRAGLAESLARRVGAGGRALDWGEPRFVSGVLAPWFELSFARGDAPLVALTAEAAASLYMQSYGPIRFFADRAGPQERRELEQELVTVFRRFATPEGVRAPRPFLLVRGRRRE